MTGCMHAVIPRCIRIYNLALGARNAAMRVTSNTTFTAAAVIKLKTSHLMWDENVRIAVSPERPLRAREGVGQGVLNEDANGNGKPYGNRMQR